MSLIDGDDLKSKGIAAIETALECESIATISIGGKERYVVLPIEHFRYLQQCEMEVALAQSKADMAAGRFIKSSPEEHLLKLQAEDQA